MHPPLPPLYYSELSFPGGARGCDKDRSFWINIRHQANSDVMWCGRRSSHRWFSCLEAKDPRYPPPHPDSALHHTLTNFPLILPNLNSCQTYKSHQPQPQPLTLIIEAETSGSVQELILQLQPSVLASIFNIFLFSINQLWKCGKDGNGITAHYDPTSLWFSTRQIP